MQTLKKQTAKSNNMLAPNYQKEEVFKLIIIRYQEKLYWHIRRIVISHNDTDDVLQNTFLKAWKGFDNFRADSQLFTWLYRIATNEALNFLKNKKRFSSVPLETNEYGYINTLSADEYICGNDIQQKLQKAILRLPEKQRIVFNMKYFDNMMYEEIAAILNTSVGALKASYHHAVKKIEMCFKEE